MNRRQCTHPSTLAPLPLLSGLPSVAPEQLHDFRDPGPAEAEDRVWISGEGGARGTLRVDDAVCVCGVKVGDAV